MNTLTLRSRRGFSLVEILIVIGILGVLVGLLLPAVQLTRETANFTHCASNLRQVGIALHQYHDAYGTMPGCSVFADVESPGRCWSIALEPWLETHTWSESRGVNQSAAQNLFNDRYERRHWYRCPSRSGGSLVRVDYAGYIEISVATGPPLIVVEDKSNSALYSATFNDIVDGLSTTVYVAEKEGLAVNYTPNYPPLHLATNIGGEVEVYSDVHVVDSTGLSSSIHVDKDDRRQVTNDTARQDGTDFDHDPRQLNTYPNNGWSQPNIRSPMDYFFSLQNGSLTIWTIQQFKPKHTLGFGSAHRRGMNMLMCDGSVQSFRFGDAGLALLMGRKDMTPNLAP